MAPVSVPCQSHTATAVATEDAANTDAQANKKRASIHYPDGKILLSESIDIG